MKAEKIAVIGAGSWGSAIAKLLSDHGRDVTLWAHRAEHVAAMLADRENKEYLAGFALSPALKITADLAQAVGDARFVVMVVPSHVYRGVFAKLVPHLAKGSAIISATKGIENDSLMTMNQVMADELAKAGAPAADYHLGVLAGPSFAREVAAGVPTAVTVAAESREVAAQIQLIFNCEFFRVYTTTDVIGTELGGALKNIEAIAAGICDGLGYGTNTRAALITRGLAEITRLGVKMGANPLTFSGLGGLGDLVLTCTGDLSRNRTVGLKLGQGKSLEQILAEMKMVAEGIKTTKSAKVLATKMQVEMPILDQVHKVIYEGKPCADAVRTLFARDLKEEMEFQH